MSSTLKAAPPCVLKEGIQNIFQPVIGNRHIDLLHTGNGWSRPGIQRDQVLTSGDLYRYGGRRGNARGEDLEDASGFRPGRRGVHAVVLVQDAVGEDRRPGGRQRHRERDTAVSIHLFGHWARERGDLTLEQAVWTVTSAVADAYRIEDRGRLTPGAWADLMLSRGGSWKMGTANPSV